MKPFLITTANKNTWPDGEQDKVFLGAWCFGANIETENQYIGSNIVSYHWDDREKLSNDFKYLWEIYERILSDLAKFLNDFQGVRKSSRYWRTVIGPWVIMYLQVMFDRHSNLISAFKENSPYQIIFLQRKNYHYVPNHMAEFVRKVSEDDFNEYIYQLLLKRLYINQISFQELDIEPEKVPSKKVTKKKRFLRWLLDQYSKKISKARDKVFFGKMRLPFTLWLKVQLQLFGMPRLTSNIEVPIFTINTQSRRLLSEAIYLKDCDTAFERLARDLLIQFFPLSYLEGYKELDNVVDNANLPEKPKSIFTTTSYADDDVFNFYAAKKVETGSKLVVVQHGGHDGTSPIQSTKHAVLIADSFFSWGWSNPKEPKIKPIGNLSNHGERYKHNPNGKAILLEYDTPRYAYAIMDIVISSQWLNYFQSQKRFLYSLPIEIREQTVARVSETTNGWHSMQRFKEFIPGLLVQNTQKSVRVVFKDARISICTYNATSIIEAMHWNFPVLAFWNEENWELTKETSEHFKRFKEVGIFHDNPESAAAKLVKIWDDVGAWWFSEQVQIVRELFCENYSKSVQNPVSKIFTNREY